MSLHPSLSHWLPESEGLALREITVGTLLSEQANRFGDRSAIIFDENELGLNINWSYSELDERVNELSKSLIAQGIENGDRVAVLSPNRPEWILLEYGLARIGATLVTVNPAFKLQEVDYLLKQGQISCLFTVGEYRGFSVAAMISAMIPNLEGTADGLCQSESYPTLQHVVSIGATTIPGALSFENLLAKADSVTTQELQIRAGSVKPQDIAQIQYTSGTTGQPKGAMLRHISIVNNGLLSAKRATYTEKDVLVSAMPLFHTAGCVCNVIGMGAVGGCLVTMQNFDASKMLDLMEKYRGTANNGVPTMYIRLLQDSALQNGQRNLSSMRHSYIGGTSVSPSLMLELNRAMGTQPVIIMGMTECSPIISQTVTTQPLALKVQNAGIPLPHVEIRIVEPITRDIVPHGQTGELEIKGFLVTAGYFAMPDKTEDAISADGWLKSGDLATLVKGGYLNIVGRIKDMLIRGGENIYPVEIEDTLVKHPDIAEAQVVGVSDAELGEEVFAFVLPRDGHTVDSDELRLWCRETIARHKLPKYIEVVKTFPQTANGKIRKVELRTLAEMKITGTTA